MLPSNNHWRTFSSNPNSCEARDLVKKQLLDRYGGSKLDPTKLYPELFGGRTVLDIGVVEHSHESYYRPGWRHRLIKNVASSTVGIDVLQNEVAFLSKQGYDVRVVDATSEADMGDRFDCVHIGDVIEHVDRPVDLLRFAARHVHDDGLIFVTTPCPYWYEVLIPLALGRHPPQNVDHVSWVVPSHALELAHRSGLHLDRYHLFQPEGIRLHLRFFHSIRRWLLPYNEIFAWAYGYVFRKAGRTAGMNAINRHE
jgi:SAM-dependent methyltransferase